jgi:hypothetical protein
MAICVVVDNPNGSAERYDQVLERIRENGEFPPPGAIFQVAGQADAWRVITLWESRDAWERFREERLRPAFAEVGLQQDGVQVSVFEVHQYMAGDLSGAVQPS